MEIHYRRAEDMLKPATYPDSYPALKKIQTFKRVAREFDGTFGLTPILVNYREFDNKRNHVGIEQHACVNCGDCITGCNYRAKNTLLMNYLPDAKNHGAQIFTECSVRSVQKDGDKWRICFSHLQKNNTESESITTDIVVVAAGTLGTNEIMLQSRQLGLAISDTIGQRFSGNGDTVALAYNTDSPINGVGFGWRLPGKREPVGATANSLIDCRARNDLENTFILLESAMPGALATLLPAALSVLAKSTGSDTDQGFFDKFREQSRVLQSKLFGPYRGAVNHTLFLLTVAQDDGKGSMTLEDDRLRIHWPDVGQQQGIRNADQQMRKVAKALGGTYIPNPIWNELTHQNS